MGSETSEVNTGHAALDAASVEVLKGHRLNSPIGIFSLTLFPILALAFYVIYRQNLALYLDLLVEDRLVEWLTLSGFALAGISALIVAMLAARNVKRSGWFFVVLGIFCIFVALEEISYGQRLLSIATPELFQEINQQSELNLHNVTSILLGFRAKQLAGVGFFLYGTLLPIVTLSPVIRGFFSRIKFAVPPVFLAPGFALGALGTIDWPTGREEEIGELFFALALIIFTADALASQLKKGAGKEELSHTFWGFILVLAMMLVALGSGLWCDQYYTALHAVTPLDGPEVSGLYSISAPSGEMPCGIFDVGEHGYRVVRLSQYPQCTHPNLDVYCLDANAQWNQNNVSDVERSPTGRLLRFYSGQHGTCAIFPR